MKIKINSLKIQDILLLKVFILIMFNSMSLSCSSNKKDTRQMNKSKGSEVSSSGENEKVNGSNSYENKKQSNNKLIIDTSETNLTPLLILGYIRKNICNTKNYPKEISKLIERYFLTNYDICHLNNNQIYIIPISFEDIFKEKGNINSMKFNFPDRGIDKSNSSFILDSLNKKNNYYKNEWKRWRRKKLRNFLDSLGYWAKQLILLILHLWN
ncbi:MAG: hypothetical protein GY830_01100 [Bacteroidetes bacterium]|nr:hypothetical protein [Bacteroidota bacterium]